MVIHRQLVRAIDHPTVFAAFTMSSFRATYAYDCFNYASNVVGILLAIALNVSLIQLLVTSTRIAVIAHAALSGCECD